MQHQASWDSEAVHVPSSGFSDEFKRWAYGQDTTLADQPALAKRLYQDATATQEATGPQGDSSIAEIEARLEVVELCDDLSSRKGICVDWFLDFFCQQSFFQKLCEFGCELWFVRKVSILRHYGIWSGAFVDHVEAVYGCTYRTKSDGIVPLVKQPATVFLSYTGHFPLSNFTESLEQLRGKYVWMDIFCVNQFAWTGQGRSIEFLQFREKLTDGLQEHIDGIGCTVLLLEKWDNVNFTLGQIWVLWEIFNTVQVKAKFSILLPSQERQSFINSLQHGGPLFQSIQSMLSSIDAETATASDKRDKTLIYERMKSEGFYNVNCQITGKAREWLLDVGREFHSTLSVPSATFLSNLGSLYRDQGNRTEARPLLEAAYRICLKEGRDNPCTLTTANDLANILSDQSEFERAEDLYAETLERREQVLPHNHPETLSSLHNLAQCWYDQSKYEKARAMFEKVIELREKTLGAADKYTLQSVNSLANLLSCLGLYDDAERKHLHVYRSRQSNEKLGDRHPDTIDSINNLAVLYVDQEKYADGEKWHIRALEGRNRLFGGRHPLTISSQNNLAGVLFKQGKLDEAVKLAREVLDLRLEIAGSDCVEYCQAQMNYATYKSAQGDNVDAAELTREALGGLAKALTPTHPLTMTCLSQHAGVLMKLGYFARAERIFRMVLTTRREALGPENPDTMASILNLASALVRLRRFPEALQELGSQAITPLVEGSELHGFREHLRTAIGNADSSNDSPAEQAA